MPLGHRRYPDHYTSSAWPDQADRRRRGPLACFPPPWTALGGSGRPPLSAYVAVSCFMGDLPILESIKDKKYSEGGFTDTSKKPSLRGTHPSGERRAGGAVLRRGGGPGTLPPPLTAGPGSLPPPAPEPHSSHDPHEDWKCAATQRVSLFTLGSPIHNTRLKLPSYFLK